MKPNEMKKLANAFGRKVAQIGSFKGYDKLAPNTTIFHSAKTDVIVQFAKDKERTQTILKEVKRYIT